MYRTVYSTTVPSRSDCALTTTLPFLTGKLQLATTWATFAKARVSRPAAALSRARPNNVPTSSIFPPYPSRCVLHLFLESAPPDFPDIPGTKPISQLSQNRHHVHNSHCHFYSHSPCRRLCFQWNLNCASVCCAHNIPVHLCNLPDPTWLQPTRHTNFFSRNIIILFSCVLYARTQSISNNYNQNNPQPMSL